MTFSIFELVPATSKVNCWVVRSYLISSVVTVMFEFARHVVKPVVVRTSLADTIIVKAARNSMPKSHRDEGGSGLILNRDCQKMLPD